MVQINLDMQKRFNDFQGRIGDIIILTKLNEAKGIIMFVKYYGYYFNKI